MNENPLADWPKLQPWAIVGVSEDTSKYGNKIYRDLKAAGYNVYGVNPKLSTVLGDPCYANLSALPQKPAVVNLVIPPQVAAGVIEECRALGINRVWFQPGAESDEAIALAQSYGIHVLANACIMIEKIAVPQA